MKTQPATTAQTRAATVAVIPVTEKNIEIIPADDRAGFGFTDARLRERGPALFLHHPALRDVLFVSGQQKVLIE